MKFDGKNIFLTGADGFIGSHLAEELLFRGANVRALVYYNSWNSLGWLDELDLSTRNNIEIIRGDIRDTERVAQGVVGSDFVFHLSSLIAIPYSYEASRSYVQTNVTGALNILEACKKSDTLEKLIHTSTSEVYGSAQKIPIDENHPLVGQSPYSASKIAADKLVESYNLSFDLPTLTARPFNTFGPRQTARAVIPTIISQYLTNTETIEIGSLSPKRDFNYVGDTVDALVELAACDKADGDVINIGTGEEWSIKETIDIIAEITGNDLEIICDENRIRPKNSEVNRLLADNRKILALTNWKPKTSFKKGLELTVNWIRDNLSLFDSNSYEK